MQGYQDKRGLLDDCAAVLETMLPGGFSASVMEEETNVSRKTPQAAPVQVSAPFCE